MSSTCTRPRKRLPQHHLAGTQVNIGDVVHLRAINPHGEPEPAAQVVVEPDEQHDRCIRPAVRVHAEAAHAREEQVGVDRRRPPRRLCDRQRRARPAPRVRARVEDGILPAAVGILPVPVVAHAELCVQGRSLQR